MLRTAGAVLLLMPLFLRVGSASPSPTPTVVPTAFPAVTTPLEGELPFQVGERMEYLVSWLKVKAGTMEISVHEETEFAGQEALRFTALGRTSKFFSRFYRVRDRYDSYARRQDLVSLFFAKDIQEGKYRAKRQEVYDHERGVARYRNKEVPVSPDARDVIASLYYLRALPLKVGDRVPMNAHGDGRSHRVEVVVREGREVTVPAGTFRTIALEPMSTFEGRVYKSETSSVVIYLSDDPRRIPVLITTKLPFGKLKAELRSFGP